MKKWIALACAVALLIGVGVFLLSTRQTPLIEEPVATSESVIAPPVAGEAPPASAEMATATAVDGAPGNEDHAHEAAAPQKPKGFDPLGGKRLTAEEFRSLSQKVAQALPTKESLKGLTDRDVHTAPTPMVEAGYQLGLLAQAVANDPTLARDAFQFYEKCARSGAYLDAVRALCFANYKDFGAKLRLPVRQDIVPANIRELAEKVQGI